MFEPLDYSLFQHYYKQASFSFLDIIGQRRADTTLESDGLGVPIGLKTPSTGAFTTLTASGAITGSGLTASRGVSTDANKNLVSLSAPVQTFLAADVALNNAGNYFNICNTGAIGAAGQVWEIKATVVLTDTAGAALYLIRIWDGSSAVYVEVTHSTNAANTPTTVTVSALVTLSAATTFHLSAKDTSSVSGSAKTTASAGTANKATSITAIPQI